MISNGKLHRLDVKARCTEDGDVVPFFDIRSKLAGRARANSDDGFGDGLPSRINFDVHI